MTGKGLTAAIPRLLLGLMFTVFGINGFHMFLPAPPSIPPDAVSFFTVMATTHYTYFTFGVQLLCGILLLANRFVMLALVMLGAVIANIIVFHLTMWPQALLPMPVVALILWLLTAWQRREKFAALFS